MYPIVFYLCRKSLVPRVEKNSVILSEVSKANGVEESNIQKDKRL